MAILDSGDRTQYSTGAVRDKRSAKGRCDLLPLDIVGRLFRGDSAWREAFELINRFQETGDEQYLIDALLSECIYDTAADMCLETSIHFREGAEKYAENNWKKGIPVKDYIDSCVRHGLKYLRGDNDEPHDRAFCWNLMAAAWTCVHKPELNEYAARCQHETEERCTEVS
jgi:hypothetical protein